MDQFTGANKFSEYELNHTTHISQSLLGKTVSTANDGAWERVGAKKERKRQYHNKNVMWHLKVSKKNIKLN